MQNAKRNSCKNDPVQTVDGSTTNQMSTDDNTSQQERSSANGNETRVLSDVDDDDKNDVTDNDDNLFNWYYSVQIFLQKFGFLALIIFHFASHTYRQKTTQNFCEVEIKDESLSNAGGARNFETMASNNDNNGAGKSSKRQKRNNKSSVNDDLSFSPFSNPLATSFDVLNLLRNNSFTTNSALGNKYNDETQLIVEMQAKEHSLRMKILQTQLETAKLNRDIAEINKIILLRNLQNTHE